MTSRAILVLGDEIFEGRCLRGSPEACLTPQGVWPASGIRRAQSLRRVQEEGDMNSDELKGKAENLKGRAKEAAGTVTGNKRLEGEGLADRAKGAVREKIGELKGDEKRRSPVIDDSDEDIE